MIEPDEIKWRRGNAFPGPFDRDPGMTLRQWYAGQALVGIIAKSPWRELTRGESEDAGHVEARVEGAFRYADAMIKAEQK